jgi:hypothetical protein
VQPQHPLQKQQTTDQPACAVCLWPFTRPLRRRLQSLSHTSASSYTLCCVTHTRLSHPCYRLLVVVFPRCTLLSYKVWPALYIFHCRPPAVKYTSGRGANCTPKATCYTCCAP